MKTDNRYPRAGLRKFSRLQMGKLNPKSSFCRVSTRLLFLRVDLTALCGHPNVNVSVVYEIPCGRSCQGFGPVSHEMCQRATLWCHRWRCSVHHFLVAKSATFLSVCVCLSHVMLRAPPPVSVYARFRAGMHLGLGNSISIICVLAAEEATSHLGS